VHHSAQIVSQSLLGYRGLPLSIWDLSMSSHIRGSRNGDYEQLRSPKSLDVEEVKMESSLQADSWIGTLTGPFFRWSPYDGNLDFLEGDASNIECSPEWENYRH